MVYAKIASSANKVVTPSSPGESIEKIASSEKSFRRTFRRFPNARSGFKAFLEASGPWEGQNVLLPAYIGWSPREGSGVFDPIAELSLSSTFYRLDAGLRIDLDHLRARLRAGGVRVLVIIHYFGYVDPGYAEAVRLAHEHGALVLEDEAHALFSDLVGGACGRLGEASILSLHKVLPVKTGGLLILGREGGIPSSGLPGTETDSRSPWEYDLWAIARRRRENARLLTRLLAPLADEVTPLRPELPSNITPQTYPVIVRRVSRDRLYEAMNSSGFGVVSLYHTLIEPIRFADYPESHAMARTILNLPVHQDASPTALEAMVVRLGECVKALGSSGS